MCKENPCLAAGLLPDFMTPKGRFMPGDRCPSSCCWGCCGNSRPGPDHERAGRGAEHRIQHDNRLGREQS